MGNHIYFVYQKCAVTLIEHEQRSKNRLGNKTLASLLLTRRSFFMLMCCSCSCSWCECANLLTCMLKEMRCSCSAQAYVVKRLLFWFHCTLYEKDISYPMRQPSCPLHKLMEWRHLKAKITDDSLNNSEHIRMCTISQYSKDRVPNYETKLDRAINPAHCASGVLWIFKPALLPQSSTQEQ